MKRDGQQGAGVESGTSKKEKLPKGDGGLGASGANQKPQSHPSEKARDGHTIK